MDHSQETIQEEVKRYITIFISLVVLTFVSVGIHSLNLNRGLSISLILMVATVQAVLSTCYLMHLISEKKLIYMVLIITIMCFVGYGLIHFGYFSVPEGTVHVH